MKETKCRAMDRKEEDGGQGKPTIPEPLAGARQHGRLQQPAAPMKKKKRSVNSAPRQILQ